MRNKTYYNDSNQTNRTDITRWQWQSSWRPTPERDTRDRDAQNTATGGAHANPQTTWLPATRRGTGHWTIKDDGPRTRGLDETLTRDNAV